KVGCEDVERLTLKNTTGAQLSTGCLPVSEFLQLPDLPFDQVSLESADMRNEQLAVQVIGFVLHSAREQLLALGLEPLSFYVLRAHCALHRASHVLAEVRQAETTFAVCLPALFVDDLGI